MKSPSRRWMHAWTMCTGLVFLAGCNTEPNTNFEKALQEQNAKQQESDPSAELFRVLPAQDRYMQSKPEDRRLRAQQYALQVRNRFDSALRSFDAKLQVEGMDSLLVSCHEAFALAIELQAAPEATGQASEGRMAEAPQRLLACREQSLAVERANSGERAEAASALKRFASAGIVLVGLTTVGRGDEQAGLELWGRGHRLAAEDQPGFKLSWRTFFGQK